MSDHVPEASIDTPQQPQSLSLAQTLCFTQLLSVLKHDILLVQPANVPTGMEEAPLVLPPSITNNCSRRKHLTNAEMRQVVVHTVGKGVVPAWEAAVLPGLQHHLLSKFSVRWGTWTYYAGIPQYIQIGGYQYTERKLTGSWISLMLVAHVSTTNCSRVCDMALSGQEEHDFAVGGWQFSSLSTTDHVWDAFIILTLLDYRDRRDTCLQVLHSGDQKDRSAAAMAVRNVEVIVSRQDVVDHCWDKCMRKNTHLLADDRQTIISDGLMMGHVRCQYPHCTKYLNNNRDRFCFTHKDLENICSIVGCEHSATAGKKSCDDTKHAEMEHLHYERGKAAFTLRDRLQKHCLAHPSDGEESEILVAEDDIKWFEMDEQGNLFVHNMENPGSVGSTVKHCVCNRV
ncbi:hypothetical protein DFH09DRAFT_1069421 [Mycena vulgaris]|nr:hypothetical protein DFH09DRAFT_1069421 [Mycena vulgaris]